MPTAEYLREWRRRNPGKQTEYTFRWREKNPELAAELARRHAAEYRIRHPERAKAAIHRRRDQIKDLVLRHYSGGNPKCAHCGLTDIRALVLDHINDDGAEDRRLNGSGNPFFRAYRRGMPPIFQVLCASCNLVKEIERQRARRR